MSNHNLPQEKRYSLPPAYEKPIPPRECKGYAIFPTGGKPDPTSRNPNKTNPTRPHPTDVSHTRAFSTGHSGGQYSKEQTHPLRGQMARDYDVYKTVDDAFNAAAKTYKATKKDVVPPEDAPSSMATYGRGAPFAPSGHRALSDLAAQSSRLAYETNQSRAYFEEQHVGRGFKSLDDHKNHRMQKDQLLTAHTSFAVLEAKHTRFAGFPEYRQAPAQSSKKGPR